MIRKTSSPAIVPASLVAWRCESLKYAGTVITACVTFSPSLASASVLSFCRIMAEISGGLYSRPPSTTRTSPLEARVILYGTLFMVRWTSGSSYLRPMRRLMEKTVFSGLVIACRRATWPTRRSPLLVMATTEGVRPEPSLFSSTVGSPASMTATTELVVPRSMPITFAITSRFLPFIFYLRAAYSAPRFILQMFDFFQFIVPTLRGRARADERSGTYARDSPLQPQRRRDPHHRVYAGRADRSACR